jgi:hypothetical protein
MNTITQTISLTKDISDKKIKDIFGKKTWLLIFIAEEDKKETECWYIEKSDIDKKIYKKHIEALSGETRYLDVTNL